MGSKFRLQCRKRCFAVRADRAFCVHTAAEAAYVYVCYSVVYEVE